jgi:hypothetical protein
VVTAELQPVYLDGTGGSGLVGGGPGHGGRFEVDIMQSVAKKAAIEWCGRGGIKAVKREPSMSMWMRRWNWRQCTGVGVM